MNLISSWFSTCKLFLHTHPCIPAISTVGRGFVFFIGLFYCAFVMASIVYFTSTLNLAINIAQLAVLALLMIRYIDLQISAISMFLRSAGVCATVQLLNLAVRQQSALIESGTAYIQAHPGEVMIAMVAGGSIFVLLRLVVPVWENDNSGYSLSRATKNFYNRIGPWTKLRRWDAEMVSAHEAGHAIVVGLLPFHKQNLEVVMTTEEDGLNGYCEMNGWASRSHSMVFLELRMLTALAGVESEKICTGERTVSATSDYEKFIDIAEKYLSCGEFELFYLDPKNELEADYNRSKVLELRRRLQHVVRALLLENREILEIIRQKLMIKGRVHGPELTELLAQVKPVPGCPKISNILKEAIREDVAEDDRREAQRAVA